jgi:hypothetical protein
MKELVSKAFSYLDYLIAPSLQELGGILGDNVKVLRHKNQLRLVKKVEEIHKKRKITPRPIPLKTLASVLNDASYEEDNRLVDMWAALLANATDSSNPLSNHHIFVKILADLSSEEAKVLDVLYKKFKDKLPNAYLFRDQVEMALKSFSKASDKDMIQRQSQIMVDNFVRLGLFMPKPTGMRIESPKDHSFYVATQLCMTFLMECSHNPKRA